MVPDHLKGMAVVCLSIVMAAMRSHHNRRVVDACICWSAQLSVQLDCVSLC